MAAYVIPDSLRENMEFMEQLSASFKERQDQETLSNVQSIHEEILAICKGREADVRETIKGLASSVTKVREEVQQAEAKGSAEDLIQSMQKEVLRARDNVDSMTAEERGLRKQLLELQSKLEGARNERTAQQERSKGEEDRCRYQLGLYAHISKATFDKVTEEHVSGTISDPENHDVREFVLSRTTSNEGADALREVDRLWELVN